VKYSEATNGTLLHALVVSFQMRVSLATALKHFEQPSDPSWDDLAMELQRGLAEQVRAQMGNVLAPRLRVLRGGDAALEEPEAR